MEVYALFQSLNHVLISQQTTAKFREYAAETKNRGHNSEPTQNVFQVIHLPKGREAQIRTACIYQLKTFKISMVRRKLRQKLMFTSQLVDR